MRVLGMGGAGAFQKKTANAQTFLQKGRRN